MFKDLFGDKPWYKSLTALGLVIVAAGQAYGGLGVECFSGPIPGMEECANILPAASTVADVSALAGSILATLGIRRAVSAESTSG